MFECPDYKAFVTPAGLLLREDQYDQKGEHILEPYQVLTTKGKKVIFRYAVNRKCDLIYLFPTFDLLDLVVVG